MYVCIIPYVLSTAVCLFMRFSVTRWRQRRELSCRRSSPHKRGTGFVYFSFWLRVLDYAEYSAFESTLNSAIVSYRIAHKLYW